MRGFVPRVRSRAKRLPLIDFSVENPLDGVLKTLPAVRSLSARKGLVFERPTSYCHFGCRHRKRTFFLTTVRGFAPPPPCPAACPFGGRHPVGVASLAAKERNEIPAPLCRLLLQSWVDQHPEAKTRLLVDVFAGWGSMAAAAPPGVLVFENDVSTRRPVDANFNMRLFSLDQLLWLAINRFFPGEAEGGCPFQWLSDRGVATLVHLSTPCQTYSVNGLFYHRGTAPSKLARAHDAMNAGLLAALDERVLGRE